MIFPFNLLWGNSNVYTHWSHTYKSIGIDVGCISCYTWQHLRVTMKTAINVSLYKENKVYLLYKGSLERWGKEAIVY